MSCRCFQLDAALLLYQSAAARFPQRAGTPFHQPMALSSFIRKIPSKDAALQTFTSQNNFI